MDSRKSNVPDWVSHQYYRHGLFCASHPRLVLFLALTIVIYSSFPLLTLPIYIGLSPQTLVESAGSKMENNGSFLQNGKPVAFVQQIVMKAMVHPYKNENLIKTDAFRAPLASSFKLHLEDVASFHNSKFDINTECLRTDGIATKYRSWATSTAILPDYGCLVMSPANLWQRDPAKFQLDSSLISTIFGYQRYQREGHSSLADLMFGLRQRDTGLTKYPVRNRQRVITYAVTIALKQHNLDFVASLKKHLLKIYPLNQLNNTLEEAEMVHMYFPPRQYYAEWIPFAITILMLFLYVYFSCHKIEYVRSKLGVALGAVATVLCAICMSLGLSGVSLNVSSKIYLVPYLVAFISLENVLVITRSVVSTPAHLDVKIRVAQGLSREGWNITKNLFAEITILTLGFFLGIMDVSVQEFCHLALMGLLADFFLQTFFFITILSLDMSQMELSDSLQKPSYASYKTFQKPVTGPGVARQRPLQGSQETAVVAPPCNSPAPVKTAKRVRLLNFIARKRIIQRLFLLCMVGWISIFIYQSSLFDTLLLKYGQADLILHLPDNETTTEVTETNSNVDGADIRRNLSNVLHQKLQTNVVKKLQPGQIKTWKRLPPTHWPMLFGLYNISLSGQYITILPPIHLSMTISPESAKMLRHPKEMADAGEDLAASAMKPIDTIRAVLETPEDDDSDNSGYEDYDADSPELSPFVPTSPSELFLAFVLAFPSLLFILYMMVVFYRCVCSRNYAEWRSSWSGPENRQLTDMYTQVVQESVPVQLDGHQHEIECLFSDGNLVVSLCLGGKLNTWDSYTGEKLAEMDRSRYFKNSAVKSNDDDTQINKIEKEKGLLDDGLSDYESGSPNNGHNNVSQKPQQQQQQQHHQKLPDFSHTINTNFTSLCTKTQEEISKEDKNQQQQPFSFAKFEKQMKSCQKRDFQDKEDNNSLNCAPTIWAMDCTDGFIVLGCSNGRVEIWETLTGSFKYAYDDGSSVGITHMKLVGLKLVIARLSGYLEFLEIVSANKRHQMYRSHSQTNSTPHLNGPSRRYHVRTHGGASLEGYESLSSVDEDLHLFWLHTARAHQQPLNCLDSRGGTVLTGSQDHTLRMFRLDDHMAVYTLHGHCGPVNTAFIDKEDVSCAVSGSQDGMLCMWDLLTGACVYIIQAHDGALVSLAYSPSYIISMGNDDRLCVWERFQGHLINSISLTGGPYCPDLIMLTHNLLVTGRQGSLVVWDARLPDPVKIVKLGDSDATHSVKMMVHLGDTVACNYGNQLKLVHFPSFSHKCD